MKNLPAFATTLLLGLSLLGCGKKTDDPQSAAGPTETVTDVPDAPTAPASASPSKMQVRVTGINLGTLQASILIDAYASSVPVSHTVKYYSKVFGKGDFVEVFNVGTATPYIAGGLLYAYDIQGKITGLSSASALPSGADMRIEMLKDGVVVRNNLATNTGQAEWRNNPLFIYSTVSYAYY